MLAIKDAKKIIITAVFCLLITNSLWAADAKTAPASPAKPAAPAPAQAMPPKGLPSRAMTQMAKDREKFKNDYMIVSLLKQANKFQQAAAKYRELADSSDWAGGKAEYLYQEAQSYWAAGNFAKAKELFTSISTTAPANLKADHKDLSDPKKLEKAKIMYQYWVQIDHARFALGSLAQIQKNTAEAVKIYQQIKEETPYVENRWRADFALAQVERNQGNLDKAAQMLEKLTAAETQTAFPPELTIATYDLFSPEREMGASRFDFTPFEEKFPVEKATALSALGDIYEEQKNYKKLVEINENLLADTKAEHKKQILRFLLAKSYEKAGMPAKAIAAYADMIKFEEEKLAEQRKFFKDSSINLKIGIMGQLAQEEMDKLKKKEEAGAKK